MLQFEDSVQYDVLSFCMSFCQCNLLHMYVILNELCFPI